MARKLISRFKGVVNKDLAEGGLLFLVLFVVILGTYVAALLADETLRQPGPFLLFTGLVLLHTILHLLAIRLIHQPRSRLAVYVVIQAAIVFVIGYVTQFEGAAMGLYLALVGEMAGLLWPDRRAVAASSAFLIVLLLLNLTLIWGSEALLQFLPMVGLMLAFVLIYVILYVRQVLAREQAQELLEELGQAHQQLQEYAGQVQELAIIQERERMARELHDTLAQGLAGLIMQLEAVDSHLEGGNTVRAQAIVQQAMQRARSTLRDARRAIQALRPMALEQGNLVDALGHAVDQFAATAGIQTVFEVEGTPPDLPPEVALDILRIAQEALSNVARHSGAGHVRVTLSGMAHHSGAGHVRVTLSGMARHSDADHVHVALTGAGGDLELRIQDDGSGFKPQEALDKAGCYGLAGIKERAERVGADLQVLSAPGTGTNVVLRLKGQTP